MLFLPPLQLLRTRRWFSPNRQPNSPGNKLLRTSILNKGSSRLWTNRVKLTTNPCNLQWKQLAGELTCWSCFFEKKLEFWKSYLGKWLPALPASCVPSEGLSHVHSFFCARPHQAAPRIPPWHQWWPATFNTNPGFIKSDQGHKIERLRKSCAW